MKFCPECATPIPAADQPSLASEKTSYGKETPEIDRLLGEIVANYRIEERIGHGGMGVVYRAVHPTIEKTVAIKFLPPAFSKSPRFVSRFQREAKAMAKLNHKNIVHIQNMGTHQGLYYLIMEYIPGSTVAEILLKKGTIQWQDVIHISKQVLQALKIAHSQGMLHRDIKPSNILVSDNGTVKVADFGLVKMMGIGDEVSIGEARSKMSISAVSDARQDGVALTIEGSPIGTFDYMSPEQYRGAGDLDGRTDIYSLGMTMYKMLTGRAARGRVKPPSVLHADIPRELDEVCFTCIEEVKDDRYLSVDEMLQALDDVEQAAVAARIESEKQKKQAEEQLIQEGIADLKKQFSNVEFSPNAELNQLLSSMQTLEKMAESAANLKKYHYISKEALKEVETFEQNIQTYLKKVEYARKKAQKEEREQQEEKKRIRTESSALKEMVDGINIPTDADEKKLFRIKEELEVLENEANCLKNGKLIPSDESRKVEQIKETIAILISRVDTALEEARRADIKRSEEDKVKQKVASLREQVEAIEISEATGRKALGVLSDNLQGLTQQLSHLKHHKFLPLDMVPHIESIQKTADGLLGNIKERVEEIRKTDQKRQKEEQHKAEEKRKRQEEEEHHCQNEAVRKPKPEQEMVVDLGGGVKLKMVWIPHGEFMMGSPDSDRDRNDDEGPQHRVRITKDFWMGKYVVTQAQWQAVMGNNPSHFKTGENGAPADTSSHPVEQVSWNDCQEFLQELSRKTGTSFRLPTEVEWEYACRAETETVYYFDNDLSYLDDYGHYNDNTGEKTFSVGRKNPNLWGLYDMHGNVWEWCEDDWHSTYNGAPADGLAWMDKPRGESRILRGGSWYEYADGCRSACRTYSTLDTKDSDIGLRVVCSASKEVEKQQRFAVQKKEMKRKQFHEVVSLLRVGGMRSRQKVILALGDEVNLELVWIPPGEFMMGSPENENSREDDEGLRKRIIITKGFWMGKYAVTQEQWQIVMLNNPSYFKYGKNGVTYDTHNHPVETISWYDCQEFLQELSSKTGTSFRLPTEAEWEYACRAGTDTAFHYGDSFCSTQANFDGNYPYGGALKGPYLKKTSVVGSYEANSFGLYDMHGNVSEWCQDWYDTNYYKQSPASDPQGPSCELARVLRGGSWENDAKYCRSARRDGSPPDSCSNCDGFRVVCSPTKN